MEPCGGQEVYESRRAGLLYGDLAETQATEWICADLLLKDLPETVNGENVHHKDAMVRNRVTVHCRLHVDVVGVSKIRRGGRATIAN